MDNIKKLKNRLYSISVLTVMINKMHFSDEESSDATELYTYSDETVTITDSDMLDLANQMVTPATLDFFRETETMLNYRPEPVTTTPVHTNSLQRPPVVKVTLPVHDDELLKYSRDARYLTLAAQFTFTKTKLLVYHINTTEALPSDYPYSYYRIVLRSDNRETIVSSLFPVPGDHVIDDWIIFESDLINKFVLKSTLSNILYVRWSTLSTVTMISYSSSNDWIRMRHFTMNGCYCDLIVPLSGTMLQLFQKIYGCVYKVCDSIIELSLSGRMRVLCENIYRCTPLYQRDGNQIYLFTAKTRYFRYDCIKLCEV